MTIRDLPKADPLLYHSQCGRELETWLAYVRGRIDMEEGQRPIRYLELGTWVGASARRALQLLPDGSVIVTVDIDQKLVSKETHGNSELIPLQGSSHDASMVPLVKELLGGDPDAIFIDADHTGDAPRKDFELWHSKTSCCLFGFHDEGNEPAVSELFWELRKKYHSFSIYDDHEPSLKQWESVLPHLVRAGIGVIDISGSRWEDR